MDTLIAQSPALVTLFKSFIEYLVITGISEDEARRGSDELLKYLYVCSVYPLLNFFPSVIVDEFWHVLISFTTLYHGVCCLLPAGQIVPHNPLLAFDADSVKDTRYGTARGAVSSHFPPPLSATYWPLKRTGGKILPAGAGGGGGSATASGGSASAASASSAAAPFSAAAPAPDASSTLLFKYRGISVYIKVKPSTRFATISDEFVKHFGILCPFKMYYNGHAMMKDETPSDYDMKDGDQLDVIVDQTGC